MLDWSGVKIHSKMLCSFNDGDRLGRELDRVVVTVVTDLSRFGW